MQHENFPAELKALPQWVAVDMSLKENGRPKKHPLNPRTGNMADVTDPATWGTFDDAIATGRPIGFVLAKADPYCIIDLDNKPEDPASLEQLELHARIIDALPTYTERSISKTGYHLICRGRIPGGVNRDHVEIYSDSRYMICTGDALGANPIIEADAFVNTMYQQMRKDETRVALVQIESVIDDEDLLEMAMNADNGDKFNSLCLGDFETFGYKSQSEADLALMSMFAFYSQDNEQCRRMFRMTNLGKREKAQKNDKYLNYTLGLIRSKEPPEMDLENLKSLPAKGEATQPTAQTSAPANHPHAPPAPEQRPLQQAVVPGVALPPGLIGEIAQYIYHNSIRPVPEVSLVAAITLFAGIVGRSYNISGSGLNQYFVLVAQTGVGKEGAASGIDSLMRVVSRRIPSADQFLGPGAFASGQALIKTLDEKPCFVSVLGEFGITLQQICDPRATGAQTMLLKVLLDLYAKSGWNKMLRSSVYSDSEKNTQLIQAPNVTIFGETTPEKFFESLDTGHVASGLIPRFSVIEYKGKRPKRNRNANIPPPDGLIEKLVATTTVALSTSQNGTCQPVTMTPDAAFLLDEFDEQADALINASENDVLRQLWNRAHLKALKLAALVAVGVNPHTPVVDTSCAQWAIHLVKQDVNLMTEKFVNNEVGTGDHMHEADIVRAVRQYMEMGMASRKSYGTPAAIIDLPVIPFQYIRRKLRLLANFKNDKRGIARAIDDAIADVVKAGIIQRIPPMQVRSKYSITTDCYVLGENWS
jgi:hypothetical protein